MSFIKDVFNRVKSDVSWRAGQEVSDKVGKGISKVLDKNKDNVSKCPKCKKGIADSNTKFCQNCGYKLIVTCSKCDLNFPIGTKFCAECGASLK